MKKEICYNCKHCFCCFLDCGESPILFCDNENSAYCNNEVEKDMHCACWEGKDDEKQ